MNLIIDIGNSSVKLAVFSNDKLLKKEVFQGNNFINYIVVIKAEYPQINKAIIASVGEISKHVLTKISTFFELLIVNSETILPFKNGYETPSTLGVDRIALAAAAVYQFPKKNVLIIDAGTCITYDFVSAKNQYLGGAISPGLQMRYKSVHAYTSKLPLLEPQVPKSNLGKSTKESIHAGIIYGISEEIDGFINRYKDKYTDLTIILTGGDAKFLSKQLKSSIFALPNFLLEGLNYILQFNTQP